jgi:hypothetical protein
LSLCNAFSPCQPIFGLFFCSPDALRADCHLQSLARLSGFALPFLKRFQAEGCGLFSGKPCGFFNGEATLPGGFAGGFAGGDGLALGGGGLATLGKGGLSGLAILSRHCAGGLAGGY